MTGSVDGERTGVTGVTNGSGREDAAKTWKRIDGEWMKDGVLKERL